MKLTDPYLLVIAMAVTGAASIVGGVAIVAGSGWAFITVGAFIISAAAYITKGLKSDG